MKKLLFIILIGFSLASHAGFFAKKDWYWTEDLNAYIATNKPLAESGEIKFSDYYSKVISLLDSFEISEKKLWEVHMRKFEADAYKAMLPYAIKFEKNLITRAELDVLRNKSNEASEAESKRLSKIEKECKWEATSRAGNYSSLDGDMTSNNPNKSIAAAIVSGFEIGSRQNEFMQLCIDAKL
jgi:hypothetical protein